MEEKKNVIHAREISMVLSYLSQQDVNQLEVLTGNREQSEKIFEAVTMAYVQMIELKNVLGSCDFSIDTRIVNF
ncbi:hypothetical protein [Enterococcus faecalis]|uniref:hypothetical protein n=1 Tax=Enterococcus faecalis TaxID=1351 RepID=UPI001572F90B|nr:hypothetical protein [Enterococcus faecalis]EGO9015654.1 hypothetical protein [Enterococcus faecalis]EHD7926728.1 hypothetical protein [Enterococcus faecalis]EKR9292373.1 hypothetical protein [Enterococcus faecalis]EKZ0208385.1 hypothetical protein [Enterococcus faecalis]MDV7868206.1 hypothetical protein [Enterococcus faecalis]